MSEAQKKDPSKKFTRLEKQWILYDVACSAYTLLATALLSFYFNFLNPTENLVSVWSLTNVIVTDITVVLYPILFGIGLVLFIISMKIPNTANRLDNKTE